MNKIINAQCMCGHLLSKYKDELVVILPCQHLIHSSCVHYIKNYKCPYCIKNIKNIRTYSEIVDIVKTTSNSRYYQIYVDMTSLINLDGTTEVNWFNFFLKIPSIIDTLCNIYLSQKKQDYNIVVDDILDAYNINLVIKNKEKLLPQNKVIIANHCNQLDSLPIFALTKCGFMGSITMKKSWVGNRLSKTFPMVLIERHKSYNTIKKIKRYMRKHGDICIFPEGVISHPKTLIRFRTGAFHLGYPVQPIIIKYDPNIHEKDMTNYIIKFSSQNKLKIILTILDPVYPPFTNEKIEMVRHAMAKAGDFALSRVSNRDLVDIL
uniref:Acyltransferase n=1 Tax=Mimivirus LCMiAC01 TaxID=2506608 RepID=A0A481Z187_9VIRU|nr:MAG: acyltransferase [Mimivirus LCMiAC01]